MTYRPAARLFLLVVLALFALGYAFRYAFLTYYISSNTQLPPEYLDWHFVNQAPLNSAMLICTGVFALFLIIAFPTTRATDRPAPDYRDIPAWGIIAFVGFVGLSLAVRAAYGATLGEEATDAGFIYGALNYRVQSDVIPGLTLLLMEISWAQRRKFQYWGAITLLAGFFLTLSAITTSKAGMVNFLALVVMLMYITGQAIWKHPVRIILAALAGILTFIVASQLRAQALGIGDSAIWTSLRDGHVFETLLQVVGLIANRIPGVEGLALSCGYSCNTIPAFEFPTLRATAIDIFTYDIVGVQHENDFRSPGYIAGAVLLFGMVYGLAAAFGGLFFGRWVAGAVDRLKFSAAAMAALMFGMLRFMMEGAWYWLDVVTMVSGVAVVEVASRLFRQSAAIAAVHVQPIGARQVEMAP
ncbi:hypothetical protein OVY29_04250 [Sphingopyxis sp. SE2]|uniref:hypothetical protein n=1 Tax=unclassified Sphingopyxis TaxID=2614943 RepID=UPI00050ECE8E|nr:MULTISPECIES: hypothetical protein [unclassified Sphingopyxis]KGB53683.1 hypothetical protein FG95_03093 [Sphingopyxis sp. LC363]MDT7527872.1 hypothetical protein [Sphingopyxis sp. SE2]